MKREFKGVWIPAEIWLNENLTIMEKLFLVEIGSLNGEKGCYASNEHFSKFFTLSKNRCSEIIKSLESKGLITINYEYEENKKVIKKRTIRVFDFPTGGTRYIDRGYSENSEESNTLSNNTIDSNIYSQIINYLNEKTNKNFRSNISKTQKLIQARIKENFTAEDFKKVIDIKTQEWLKDSTMSKYLRPETLFGSKFEGYLNESEGKNVNKGTKSDGFKYSGFSV